MKNRTNKINHRPTAETQNPHFNNVFQFFWSDNFRSSSSSNISHHFKYEINFPCLSFPFPFTMFSRSSEEKTKFHLQPSTREPFWLDESYWNGHRLIRCAFFVGRKGNETLDLVVKNSYLIPHTTILNTQLNGKRSETRIPCTSNFQKIIIIIIVVVRSVNRNALVIKMKTLTIQINNKMRKVSYHLMRFKVNNNNNYDFSKEREHDFIRCFKIIITLLYKVASATH